MRGAVALDDRSALALADQRERDEDVPSIRQACKRLRLVRRRGVELEFDGSWSAGCRGCRVGQVVLFQDGEEE